MDPRNPERRAETCGIVRQARGRTPLALTREERRLLELRVRELKGELPPRVRVIQVGTADLRDRENYRRASNELDCLLEILLLAATTEIVGTDRRGDHERVHRSPEAVVASA